MLLCSLRYEVKLAVHRRGLNDQAEDLGIFLYSWHCTYIYTSFQITILVLKDAYLLKPLLQTPSFVLRVSITLSFTPQDPQRLRVWVTR